MVTAPKITSSSLLALFMQSLSHLFEWTDIDFMKSKLCPHLLFSGGQLEGIHSNPNREWLNVALKRYRNSAVKSEKHKHGRSNLPRADASPESPHFYCPSLWVCLCKTKYMFMKHIHTRAHTNTHISFAHSPTLLNWSHKVACNYILGWRLW